MMGEGKEHKETEEKLKQLVAENKKVKAKAVEAEKLICVQSNDYFSLPEHVNCSKNLSEFAKQTPMSECLYEGVLDLIKYNRFMRIGIR